METKTSEVDRYPGEAEDILKKIRETGDMPNDDYKEENTFLLGGLRPVESKRISKDEYYLGIAAAVAARSTCLKRRYGAVIVKDDEIIATGYNGNPRGEKNCFDVGFCSRLDKPHNSGDYSDCYSVHAEQNAMLSASRSEMLGSTLYLYGEQPISICLVPASNYSQKYWQPIKAEPCPICGRMIKNAGIKRVVGGA
jgi:dCMP deaminase